METNWSYFANRFHISIKYVQQLKEMSYQMENIAHYKSQQDAYHIQSYDPAILLEYDGRKLQDFLYVNGGSSAKNTISLVSVSLT